MFVESLPPTSLFPPSLFIGSSGGSENEDPIAAETGGGGGGHNLVCGRRFMVVEGRGELPNLPPLNSAAAASFQIRGLSSAFLAPILRRRRAAHCARQRGCIHPVPIPPNSEELSHVSCTFHVFGERRNL